MKISLIVFDWAGTLVDFGSRAPIEALLKAFKAAGISVSETIARKPMGMHKRDHIRTVLLDPEVAVSQDKLDEVTDRIYEIFLPMQRQIVADYSLPIAGVPNSLKRLKELGIRIGSSTGYTRDLMEIIVSLAAKNGIEPEFLMTASDDCPGRPAPDMILRNAAHFAIEAMETVVKVDDTTVGIEAARNAGCWAVGVSSSGNLLGISEEQFQALDPAERSEKVNTATEKLYEAGAHLVLESAAGVVDSLSHFEEKLKRGERP